MLFYLHNLLEIKILQCTEHSSTVTLLSRMNSSYGTWTPKDKNVFQSVYGFMPSQWIHATLYFAMDKSKVLHATALAYPKFFKWNYTIYPCNKPSIHVTVILKMSCFLNAVKEKLTFHTGLNIQLRLTAEHHPMLPM